MSVSYKKLFNNMVEKDMTNVQMQQQAGVSANIIIRMKRDCYISLESEESVYRVMNNCKVDDILAFIPDKGTED